MKMAYLSTSILLVTNGLIMLVAPESWYALTPGASETGPLNDHFVRDIGVAYLIAGAGLLWRAVDSVRGWPAAVAGAGFLLGHAVVHLFESLFGHAHGGFFEWTLVYAGSGWVAWLALPGRTELSRWLKPALRRQVAQFETQFGYDAQYMHEMLDADTDAFLQFGQVVDLAKYRKSVPPQVWHATKITAAISEDCGPCAQLAVTMAAMDGVSEEQLQALIAANEGAMNEQTKLGFVYARNVINHSPQASDCIAAIEARWGKKATISLALALSVARVFPMVKYGMGHGQTCARQCG